MLQKDNMRLLIIYEEYVITENISRYDFLPLESKIESNTNSD